MALEVRAGRRGGKGLELHIRLRVRVRVRANPNPPRSVPDPCCVGQLLHGPKVRAGCVGGKSRVQG